MSVLIRGLVLGAAACAAALIVTLGVFLAVEKRAAAAAPQFTVTRLGGLEYQSIEGRALNPASTVDRPMLAGLPARFRHLPHGELLYGAFIAVSNPSHKPIRSAPPMDLLADDGPTYRPLPLAATSPYAYTARVVGPGTRIPAFGSVADRNLAAGAGSCCSASRPPRSRTAPRSRSSSMRAATGHSCCCDRRG